MGRKVENKNLPYDKSIRILLTKGVCGHGHFEGNHITERTNRILKRIEKLYRQDRRLSQRFEKLTGKTYKQVLDDHSKIISSRNAAKGFDFVRDFLPSLYVMKLCEASSPDIIYEHTKGQLLDELSLHSGFSREIYPLVWLEMGLDYTRCTEAFVSAIEDVLLNRELHGPIYIGISVKRQHLTRNVNPSINPFLHNIEYPYKKYIETLKALLESKIKRKVGIFINTVDLARRYPLFSSKQHTHRTKHTARLYKEANELGAIQYVHLLEELVDTEIIAKKQKRTKELDFIIDLFTKLNIRKARFIHMAYWPQNLPKLKYMRENDTEISVCQTSTRIIGKSHKPISPFLLENKRVVYGIAYDEDFPRVIISTDDQGSFRIQDVWSEYITIYKDIRRWHGIELADICIIQFLRNAYQNQKPYEISMKYNLNRKAVEWVQGYDIYKKKSEIQKKQLSSRIHKRVFNILSKRNSFTK